MDLEPFDLGNAKESHQIWTFFMGKEQCTTEYEACLPSPEFVLKGGRADSIQPTMESFETWNDLSPDLQLLLRCLNAPSRHAVLLGGMAGSGKSYLVQQLIKRLGLVSFELTAPTAVAASNISGATIYKRLCLWKVEQTVDEIWDQLTSPATRNQMKKTWRFLTETQLLIIDEISMLNPDLFDKLDVLFQRARGRVGTPFGGVKLFMIGDFCQLGPVIKNGNSIEHKESEALTSIFRTKAWSKLKMARILLTRNYRQGEGPFLNICNHARINQLTEEEWKVLESRCLSREEATKICSLASVIASYDKDKFHPSQIDRLIPIYICSTNKAVEDFNKTQKDLLINLGRSELLKFSPQFNILPFGSYRKIATDDYKTAMGVLAQIRDSKQQERFKSDFPVFDVSLCVGSQVMLRCNAYYDDGLYNGSMGIVKAFRDKEIVVNFMNKDGSWQEVAVKPYEFKTRICKTACLVMRQYPLSDAYSMTIHKCQGITLPKAVIDLSNTFTHGQAYVAISRLQTLEGLHLVGLNRQVFMIEPENVAFETAPDHVPNDDHASNHIPKHDSNEMEQEFDMYG